MAIGVGKLPKRNAKNNEKPACHGPARRDDGNDYSGSTASRLLNRFT